MRNQKMNDYKAVYKKIGNLVNVDREMILDNQNMYCIPERELQKQDFFDALQKDLRSQIFYE